jgi:Xaa-Pro aminopeptidase
MSSLALTPIPTLNLAAIQAALAAEDLDGWLLYDFRGLNTIATDVTGVGRQGGHLATRRWFYLVPVTGEPLKLVHAIESHTLAHLPGRTLQYAGREALERGVAQLTSGLRRVAMEYSPRAAIPYVSRVDAGTVELVRACGVEVASSGDLVQRFSAVWDAAAIASHVAASDRLYRIKDRALDLAARRTRDGIHTTEYDIQTAMAGWFADEGLVSDSPPNVSVGPNSGNPHYLPTADASTRLAPDALLLLDLWGKLDQPGAMYADITWMGFLGRRVPEEYARVFEVVRAARDAAVDLVRDRAVRGADVRGWEVDRAARGVLEAAGFGDRILHRTGHSLGETVHGTGVNMDDFETHDDRRLLPGTGFTIEPGLYTPAFGVRTEINLVMFAGEARVTGPRQQDIPALL